MAINDQRMNLAIDENGNPYLLLREQEKKSRIKGLEAYRSNIMAARAVADVVKTSLGPKGMDKILVDSDGKVVTTNDGATILSQMEVENPCAKLMVQMSSAQDNEIGDGTTGIVVLAGELLHQADQLIEGGLHPTTIMSGFHTACNLAVDKLETIAITAEGDRRYELLLHAAETALASKVVSGLKKKLAKVAVDAVLAVADLDRNDVNFDMIKVLGIPGGNLEDTNLVSGIVIEKDLSHPQMAKVIKDAKIAILTVPFEPAKPKIKHQIQIKTSDDYEKLQKFEQKYFSDMIMHLKNSGANMVMCQWGFDDEANHLLASNNIPAVRWVGGVDVELLAILTKASIIPRFEEIKPERLGHAALVEELCIGTERTPLIVVKGCENRKAVTIIVRGGTNMIVSEAERSIHDAICVIRNLIKDFRLVPGGGATEVALSRSILLKSEQEVTVEGWAIQAFATALLIIPTCLATNSGLSPYEVVADIIQNQTKNENDWIGLSIESDEVTDMNKVHVYETFNSKRNQFLLACQLVNMILRIDDIFTPTEYE